MACASRLIRTSATRFHRSHFQIACQTLPRVCFQITQSKHRTSASCGHIGLVPHTRHLPVSSACLHTSGYSFAKKGKKHKTRVDVGMSADDDILNLEDVRKDMQKVVDALRQDYTKSLNIRTSQGALDHILVPTPDGKFPLNQLAQITTKSASMMSINLSGFPQVTDAAAKAIRDAGMNLNPQVDGSIIQVPVPKVTKEHRENLAKSAKGMCDKAKVNLRNVRTKYVNVVKKHKGGTSRDTIFKLEKQIQQVTDDFTGMAEQLLAGKTKELLGK